MLLMINDRVENGSEGFNLEFCVPGILMDGCAYKALNTIKEFKKTSFNPP